MLHVILAFLSQKRDEQGKNLSYFMMNIIAAEQCETAEIYRRYMGEHILTCIYSSI